MSDGDVSLIRDEDVLRRMWQQTEDFSRKKEIRAHMYRLREERLRNLYSPEPSLDAAKGCEFTSTQGHVKSFADQNFQSMKSKEVRDAGSPPKEFNYRGQDLKDLSNAGWNVESENKTTDDGHTRVKSINANIEGRYDVDGGKGHFTAADHQKQAVTEYNDGNMSLKRNEDYSNTSAHEQVVRQTGDGTHFTSTSSSSSSASKIEQISSTHKSVPYEANDNYDLQSQTVYDDNRNDEFTTKESKTSTHNQTLRNDYEQGELLSRNIDYPDDNTKVVIETRRLPDGTKVTSTRREFRAPSVQTRRSQHSEQIKSESKSTSYSSTQKRTNSNELSTNVIHDESYNTNMQDIVDSQRNKDDFDFKKNDVTDCSERSQRGHYEDVRKCTNDEHQNNSTKFYDNKTVREENVLEKTVYNRKDYTNKDTCIEEVNKSNERKRNDYFISDDNKQILKEDIKNQEDVQCIQKDFSMKDSLNRSDKNTYRKSYETTADNKMNRYENKEGSQRFRTTEEYLHNISQESEVKENVETRSSHQYQTTYQTDYTHRKISTELSPSHQAWASTLRSDTPPRSTSRAPSPGNKTYKSSTSSLRSSVSPDKIYKKTSSRGASPNKVDRYSPTRTSEQIISNTQLSSYSVRETNSNKYTDIKNNIPKNKSPTRHLHSPERKPFSDKEKRSSISPEKQTQTPRASMTRPSTSPQRKPGPQSGSDRNSPTNRIPTRNTPSPERNIRQTSTIVNVDSKRDVCDRQTKEKDEKSETIIKTNIAEYLDTQPSYMRPTASSSPKNYRASSPTKQNNSDQKSSNQQPSQSPIKQLDDGMEGHERSVNEENKTYTSSIVSKNIMSNIHSELDVIHRQDTSESFIHHSEKDDGDETIINAKTNAAERPSYMRPTASSSPKSDRASSPTKQTHSNKKSPTNQPPSQSPDMHLDNKGEHERFAFKEENKTYTSISDNITSNIQSKCAVIHTQDTSTTSTSQDSKKDDGDQTIINVKNNVVERPDNQPNYMKPTASSSPKEDRASSPTKPHSNKKSPTNKLSSQSPDMHLENVDEHERFVNEENKTYTSITDNITSNIQSKCDVIHTQDTSTTSTSQDSKKDDEDQTIINVKNNIVERSDNQPSYMRPTESSSPKSDRASSPTKQRYSDQKSPVHKLPSQCLDRQFDNLKEKDDHLIMKDNKKNTICESILSNVEKDTYEINKTSRRTSSERNKVTSATRVSPTKDLPPTVIANTQTDNTEILHKNCTTNAKYDIINQLDEKDKPGGHNKQPSRESSPIKRQMSPDKIISKSNKEIHKQKPGVKEFEKKDRSPSPLTKELSMSPTILKRDEKTEQVVDTGRNNKIVDKNIHSKSTTPSTTSSSRSTSPNKSTTDAKNKQTLEFIATEVYNEEFNKRTAKKPRTLHTPSTSPSRKPKSDETTPSTGESSPTTDSGFIYFSSKMEDHLKTEVEFSKEPKSIDGFKTAPNDSNLKEHQRTPSTTKIPCRSPSPEKVINKENLPRKSSLKKPSFDNSSIISPPKPPTSFLISPDNEEKEVLKEKLNERSDKPMKTKPPLERRETYDERCRKILGMTNDSSTIAMTTTRSKSGDTDASSVSPRESPIQVEENVLCDNYGLVDIVDLTSKTSITNTLQTDTSIKDIQISSEANRVKSTQKSLIDQSETLEQTLDNVQDKNSRSQDDLEFKKPTDNDENELSLNEINSDKVCSSNHFQRSEEIKKITETVSEFITTQKEQEILDRVRSSLRKLSPDRKSNSKLPLPNDKIIKDETINQDSKDTNDTAIYSEDTIASKKKLLTDKSIGKNQIPSKPSSRNTSPIKKPVNSQNLTKHSTETVKPRSNSPKKPLSPVEKKHAPSIERPQSPQVSKTTILNKEQNQRTPLSIVKSDRSDLKKSSTKSLSITKTSPTKIYAAKTVVGNNNKIQDTENKTPQKSTQSSISKKEVDSKVLRTSSDINIKSPLKKVSPQRIKSKPEIQLNNVTTNKVYKQNSHTLSSKTQKSNKEVSTKLPVSKPKSAIALNTSMDENDDIIIDVQQAKSSRENSPDRICPTPVGFSEDTGTPRFPDEVNEPDDEINKRSHNIIHETESIVDDIVEICEEDELFVKTQETERYKIKQKSRSTDKCTKSNTSITSNKNEVHCELIDKNLKSDECLLSVSEKVNKFATGQVINKDKSPSRNIKEEYDKETIYTDDYTKLSVNDKAHLFIETAENVKTTKPKFIQKPVRPDLSNVDESLKSDECLLSVSDKVNKFVKTAEHISSDTHIIIDEKEKKIQEEHEKIMKKIVDENLPEQENISMIFNKHKTASGEDDIPQTVGTTDGSISKSTTESNNLKPVTKQTDKRSSLKITTLRSSEAVKKAKALFENIASTAKTKETSVRNRTTKLTDIGVSKKSPRSEGNKPAQDSMPKIQQTDFDEEQTRLRSPSRQKSPEKNEIPSSEINKDKLPINRAASPLVRDDTSMKPITREKSPLPRSPNARDKSPMARTKSPVLREVSPISTKRSPISQTATIVPKKVLSRLPVTEQVDSTKPLENKHEKSVDKLPGYQRPTKTSQLKEEKHIEEIEVSSRRGSGKFGVELRRTSTDRSSVSSERRRSSVEHHQPCIEDIFDLDLLEQMLEKVVGYEQRRRIRAQMRVAKKKIETQEATKIVKDLRQSTSKIIKTKSPERLAQRSPEREPTSKKDHLPETQHKSIRNKSESPDCQHQLSTTAGFSKDQEESQLSLTNGHQKETKSSRDTRKQSPEKHMRSTPKTVPQSSSDKKRPASPTKMPPNTKGTRFSEYASAYMKKVGLHEKDKLKHRAQVIDDAETQKRETKHTTEVHHVRTTIDRTSSKDVIEVQIEGKKSPSPSRSSDRDVGDITQPPHRQGPGKDASFNPLSEPSFQTTQRQPSPNRSPTPEKKKIIKKETRTTFDIENKIAQKQVQDDKPSWVTNRNLKKVTSESRTFSNKKIETEKPKYRPSSPSKTITKPIDVITSSYGPGPLDADGRPLFGIKALRNGATNYQVKGTVIRQEFHSRNGSEPEGTVSVTAYSTEPEDLEKLLQTQGEKPSRLHGLAAITTTKKFGGDTGTTLSEVATKEERAALEQFTHSDRRITEGSHTDTQLESLQKSDQREKIERVSNKTETNKVQNQKLTNQTVQSSVKKDTRKDLSQKETRSDRMQRMERRVEDRKTVRQSSVKSLTEKFIKNASETTKTERTVYPKAGLILRTAGMKDSVSSDSSAHAGLARTDSEHSLASIEDMMTTTTTTTEQLGDVLRTTTTVTKTGARTHERSFLDSSTKVTGVQDILTRMKNADIVIEDGDSNEDTEARALLNKFLGATVLMAGMQNYVSESGATRQERSKIGSGVDKIGGRQTEVDIEQCWDERVLRKLLDECTDYELRRRLRARIRALMAEQEACASAVTEALAAAGETVESAETEEHQQTGEREEEEITNVTTSVRRNSTEQSISSTSVKSTKVIESQSTAKPVSPFAKFRQLEKQNSINSPNSPKTPQSPGSPSQPYFKFTDPALQLSAVTIKERLLQWCRDKTRDYENVKLENFSTSWADGLAFCALLHHFLPDAFDYSQLTPDKRRHNFTLAFKVADEKAGIYPLLDVDDMVAMRKPDWKCVFTYVQSIHRRFKDEV